MSRLPNQPIVIGIVEDDGVHTTLIEATLASAGYASLSYDSAEEFRRRKGPENVELVLLDWRMPGESGLSLLQSLRAEGWQRPVIFVTANREESQAVQALDAGGDDYVVKPIRRGELLARIRTVLRRPKPVAAVPASACESYGVYRLDTKLRTVSVQGKPLKTLPKEFDLLHFLFRRAGQVVSREAMLAQVWRTRTPVPTRTIDTYISRLRRNFGLDGRHGWRIDGIYLQGYRLTSCPETKS